MESLAVRVVLLWALSILAVPGARAQALRSPDPIPLRHPVVLVHGILAGASSGDPDHSSYFRGVVEHLRARGVTACAPFLGKTNGVFDRSRLLLDHIQRHHPTGKLNLIAHSLGGLDCRYLISNLGMADRVSSLTTIATPHHGTLVADFVVKSLGHGLGVERLLNALGFPTDAFHHLTTDFLRVFNPSTPDEAQVRYFSVGGAQFIHKMKAPLVPFGWLIRLKFQALAGKTVDEATRSSLMAESWGPMILGEIERTENQVKLHGVKPADLDAFRETRGVSDGVVPLASTPWGESFDVVDMDHLDQIGWPRGSPEIPRYYEALVRYLAELGL